MDQYLLDWVSIVKESFKNLKESEQSLIISNCFNVFCCHGDKRRLDEAQFEHLTKKNGQRILKESLRIRR